MRAGCRSHGLIGIEQVREGLVVDLGAPRAEEADVAHMHEASEQHGSDQPDPCRDYWPTTVREEPNDPEQGDWQREVARRSQIHGQRAPQRGDQRAASDTVQGARLEEEEAELVNEEEQ